MNKMNLGKVVLTPKGNYDASIDYEKLDMIRYQNGSYMVLKPVKGITPTNDLVNYQLIAKDGGVNFATFSINNSTGELEMYTTEEFSGTEFKINDQGFMEVTI